MKILVTGASGFIGSAFVRRTLDTTSHSIVAVSRISNAKFQHRIQTKSVQDAISSGRVNLVYADLLVDDISGICEGVDAVVHFAARTYVDHSIKDVMPFIQSNIMGTYTLLEDAKRNHVKRFIHISTDEVYGSILNGAHAENSPTNPTNPYAASKAGADALTISYAHTFGMHTTVTRTENNYGPWQHPQKVIPVFTHKAINDQSLPIYGDGGHSRQWLWVDDHVDALIMLLEKQYDPGKVFHIAGNQELTNLDLAGIIIKTVGKGAIEFIDDKTIRPGHDRRYALKCDAMNKMGWYPKIGVDEGIQRAVKWYMENEWWMR